MCSTTGGLVDTVKEGCTGFHMGPFSVEVRKFFPSESSCWCIDMILPQSASSSVLLPTKLMYKKLWKPWKGPSRSMEHLLLQRWSRTAWPKISPGRWATKTSISPKIYMLHSMCFFATYVIRVSIDHLSQGPAKKWEQFLLSLGAANSEPGIDSEEVAPVAVENVAAPWEVGYKCTLYSASICVFEGLWGLSIGRITLCRTLVPIFFMCQ